MRVILAGLGGMGTVWAGVLAEHPEVQVVGYVEPDEERRTRVAAERGLPPERCYGDLAVALSQAGAEALVDVTPPSVHPSVSGAALRAGLHVIPEKPLAATIAEARTLADLAHGRGMVHMVAQNYRFQPIARTIRRLIASGRIGKVGAVSLRFAVGARWKPTDFRVTMEQPLLLDMSIHHMDLLRACLGEDPDGVYARSWNPPGSWYAGDAAAAATFSFGERLAASYSGSWSALGDQTTWNGEWHIEGESAGLVWDQEGLWLAEGEWTRGSREALPIDATESEGQRAVLDEFLAAVRENREPECSSRDNLKSLAMVFGATESARTGVVVRLG